MSRHLMKCKVDRFGFEDNTRLWLSDEYLIMHVYLKGKISKEYFNSVGARK